METTASDGRKYQVDYYNLYMILSIGYMVNNVNATRFRQWANSVLRDYVVKGYYLNLKSQGHSVTSFSTTLFTVADNGETIMFT